MDEAPDMIQNPDDGEMWVKADSQEGAEDAFGASAVIEVVMRRDTVPTDHEGEFDQWWTEEHRPEFQTGGENYWRIARREELAASPTEATENEKEPPRT